jgi:hypothetical protein
MKKVPILFLTVILWWTSCKKDDTGIIFTLPAKTQTGKNTLGFLLNSQVWTNYGKIYFLTAPSEQNITAYYPYNGGISIQADRVLYKNGGLSSTETFTIAIEKTFTGTNSYNLSSNDNGGVYYTISDSLRENYYCSSELSPSVNVTINKFDTTNKIISGEFFGKLYKQILYPPSINYNDSIIIDQGRFDVKY